jgi:uncharacterized protein
MKIYVDADGFPGAAKDILIRGALRMGVPLVFVANKPVRYERSLLISSLVVPEGPDIADDCIVKLVEPGDLVVTADIPLADRVVSAGAFALNPRGTLYTKDNIKDRLSMRDLLSELRNGGLMTGGPSAFGKKDRRAFADQLDRFLVRRLKAKKKETCGAKNFSSADGSKSER